MNDNFEKTLNEYITEQKDCLTKSFYIPRKYAEFLKDTAEVNGCNESYLVRLALKMFIDYVNRG